MKRKFAISIFCVALAVCVANSATADPKPIEIAAVKHEGPVQFQKDILPILQKKCLACHNATEAESDLVLETPASILKGGAEGPAAVAGKGAESLMLKLAAYQTDPVMPPEDNDVGAKPFTPQELGLLKLWIDQGAKMGDASVAGPVQWQPLPPGVNPIYAIAVSQDGQYAAAGRANQIFMYHLPSKREMGRLTDPSLLETGMAKKAGVAHLDLVQSLAFSPDGRTLASGGYRNVKLWQRDDLSATAKLEGVAGPKSSAVSSDGKWAAIGQENGEIKLFALPDGALKQTLKGHSAAVSGLAFSADDKQLVSGSQDKTIRVWDVAAGKQAGVAIETPAPINAVAWALEGKQIATGHADSKIRTWALPTEKEAEEPVKPIKELSGHSQPVTSLVAFPADGSKLLSGSLDATLRQWNATSGAAERTMSHGGPVMDVAVNPDASRFASVSTSNNLKLWNAANGQQLAEQRGDYRKTIEQGELKRAVALSKQMVAIAKKDVDEGNKRKTAEEANLKKSEETAKTTAEELKKKQEAAKKPAADKEAAEKTLAEKQAAFTAAEEAKAKAAETLKQADEELKKIEAERAKLEGDARKAADKKFEEATKKRTDADAENKKAVIASAKIAGEVKQAEAKLKQVSGPAQKAADELAAADRAAKAAVRSVERAKQSVQKATDALPGLEAAQKAADEQAKKVAAELAEAQKAVSESAKPIQAVAFSPDGVFVATAGDGQSVQTWSADTAEPIDVYPTQGAAMHTLSVSANGIVTTSTSGAVSIWPATASWRLVRTIGSVDSDEAFEDRVTALDFSSDGALLATGGGEPSRNGELKIWKVADGSPVRVFADIHSDTIFDVEFSPDDTLLASCGADRFMKVSQVADGKFVKAFEGHTHHVLGVDWSATGMMLATAGADSVIKVWDYRTGNQTRTITGFKKEVTSISFVGESANVVASCGDKNVHMKRTDNGGNIRSFAGGSDFMHAAEATPDGKRIVGGGQDSVLRVWTDNGQSYVTFEPPQAAEEK